MSPLTLGFDFACSQDVAVVERLVDKANFKAGIEALSRTAGKSTARSKLSQAPAPHCTRKSPLPLLPSGPGGFGGSTSRKTDA